MAGVRLRGEFSSLTEVDYQVDIYDEDYVGGVNAIDSKNVTITYMQEDDEILEPILSSRASFDCYNFTAAFDSFLADFILAEEGQFKLLIYKDTVLEWVGIINHDLTGWDNESKPRSFRIMATDGIGRLEDLEWSDVFDGGYPVQNSLLKIIKDVLELNNLSQFWGTTDAYFKESIDWFDTQITSPATTDSPLILTRAHKNMFINRGGELGFDDIDFQDEDKPMNAQDVIRGILQLFGARIFHAAGVYYIQQVENFTGSTYNERLIRKDASTVNSASSESHRQAVIDPDTTPSGADIKHLANGRVEYFAPLNKVIAKDVLNTSLYISHVTDTLLDTVTTPISETIQLGTLRGGGGSGRGMRITIALEPIALAASAIQNPSIKVEIKVIAGSNRVLSTDANPQVVQWTVTAADLITRNMRFHDGRTTTFTIDVPELPFTEIVGCTLELTVTMVAKKGSISFPVVANWQYLVRNFRIYLTDEGETFEQNVYEVDNPASTANSILLDFGNMLISDAGILSSLNTFEVNTTGSTWKESDVWDAGFTVDTRLIQSFIQVAMALQKTPVEKLLSNIDILPLPFKTVFYDSRTYIFNGGTMDLRNDEVNGEWFELLVSKTGISVGDSRPYQARQGDIAEPEGPPQEAVRINDREFTFITTIDEEIAAGGSITTIVINAVGFTTIKDDDTIHLLSPTTFESLDFFVVDGDVTAAATSITVDSKTTNNAHEIGAIVAFKRLQIVASDTVRGVQLNSSGATIPTSDSDTTGELGDIVIDETNGITYYKAKNGANERWFRVVGTLGW